MDQLAGKVVLITGAARGQGRHHAVVAAEEGADVIAFDACGEVAPVRYRPATTEDLDTTCALVEQAGGRVVPVVGDVRVQADLDRAVREGMDALGRLDVVIANAGVCAYGRVWEVDDDHWDSIIGTNLTGVWRTYRATIPVLIEQGEGGSLVSIASMAGTKALPGLSCYSASKHGLVGLTKATAVEVGPYGIRANTVLPGAVETEMAGDEAVAELLEQNPSYLQSFGSILTTPEVLTPADVTAAVMFLASDAARAITGATFAVDRGSTAV